MNNPDVWTTRDGRRIPISEMTTEHLHNTIRYLRRRAMPMQLHMLGMMNAYIRDAGDAASAACMAEADVIIEMDEEQFLGTFIPQWTNLLAESKRR